MTEKKLQVFDLRKKMTLLVFLLICVLAAVFEPSGISVEKTGRWYSILPPIIAVALAVLTRRLLFSLVFAVIAGGVIFTIQNSGFDFLVLLNGVFKSAQWIWGSVTDSTNILILVFVVFVMMLIAVMLSSGGLQGLIQFLEKYAKDRYSAKLLTVLMGLVVFIDDYANTMIVGSSMRPVTDRYKISREKLAFLVDATSAPVAGIAFVSTWIGYEVGLFSDQSKTLGLGQEGYSMFFDALGFRFYCILMIVFVILNVLSKRDFGPMKKAEERAFKKGQLYDLDADSISNSELSSTQPSSEVKILALSSVIPISFLLVSLFVCLWIDGNGMSHLNNHILSVFNPLVWRDVLSASEHSVQILAIITPTSWLLAGLCGVYLSKMKWSTFFSASLRGLKGSLLPMAILILAWSLKETCTALKTGPYLVEILSDVVSPIWFPAALFIAAGLTAFATGTSWGTMAILIPTAIPLAFELDGQVYGLMTMISLGAILDGAIFGDHCSPISDTTVMTSIATSCDVMHHVRTQLPYGLFVGSIALMFGYIPAALGVSTWITLPLSMIVMTGIFFLLTRRSRLA